MTGFWQRAPARVLDALLPNGCVVCARPLRSPRPFRPPAFCGPCERALPWWRQADGCPRCGTRRVGEAGCAGCLSRSSPLQASHVALRYSGPIARWIPAIKRPSVRTPPAVERAIGALSEALAERVARTAGGRLDVVTSLPLHPARLRERGFNQADPIAHRVALRLGRPFAQHLLERTRRTATQASLEGDARRANVRGAFRATATLPRDLRVALVDDVLTTGASLEAAASALLEAGALEVRAIALAATLPRAPRRPAGNGIDRDPRETPGRAGRGTPDRRAVPHTGGGPPALRLS